MGRRLRARLFAFANVALLGIACATHAAPTPAEARIAPDLAPPPATAPTAPVRAPDPRDAERAEAARAVADACVAKREGILHVTLAHFNDLQARYSDRIAGKSRYGYLAGAIEALQAAGPTLVLDAGDDYEKGAVAELESMGAATRRMVHALPIDARVIGNHDFAYGEAAVIADATTSPHPLLAANISRPDGGKNPFVPYAEIDVGCARIGVVGLVTGNYGADDKPTKDPFDGVFAEDDRYSTVAAKIVEAHRDEVDVMIALTHIGSFPDAVLASKVPGIDLVVGGHTEELFYTPRPVYRAGGRAYVLQAGHWGQTYGVADLAIDPRAKKVSIASYKIAWVDAHLPYDPVVGDLADAVELESAPDAHRPFAHVAATIARGNAEDALVWKAVKDRLGADALVLGRDVFWSPLDKGPLTLQRLFDAVLVQREPAGTSGFDSLLTLDVTGADLAKMRARILGGHAFFGPAAIDPKATYRLAIEKRAALVPSLAFRGVAPMEGEPAGELVDVLADYARVQEARGLTLDGVKLAR